MPVGTHGQPGVLAVLIGNGQVPLAYRGPALVCGRSHCRAPAVEEGDLARAMRGPECALAPRLTYSIVPSEGCVRDLDEEFKWRCSAFAPGALDDARILGSARNRGVAFLARRGEVGSQQIGPSPSRAPVRGAARDPGNPTPCRPRREPRRRLEALHVDVAGPDGSSRSPSEWVSVDILPAVGGGPGRSSRR